MYLILLIKYQVSSINNISLINKSEEDKVKNIVEQSLAESIKNTQEIIFRSATLDVDRFYKKTLSFLKLLSLDIPIFLDLLNKDNRSKINIMHQLCNDLDAEITRQFIDEINDFKEVYANELSFLTKIRQHDFTHLAKEQPLNQDGYESFVKLPLKTHVGNCYEMACICALLMKHTIQSKLVAAKNELKSQSVIEFDIDIIFDDKNENDHVICQLLLNIDGNLTKYFIDPFVGKYSEFNSNRHIDFYSDCDPSCYVNEQLNYTKCPMSDYITRNDSVYFRFERDIKDIFGVDLSRKTKEDPFELRREKVQQQLDMLANKQDDSIFSSMYKIFFA